MRSTTMKCRAFGFVRMSSELNQDTLVLKVNNRKPDHTWRSGLRNRALDLAPM
jgi:hypothetical protein